MSRCRTLIFSLLATLLYATNGVNSLQYSSNMFLNGQYQNGVKSQPQQFSVNPASNIFLEHAIISRQASSFQGPTYLPPKEFLKCSNGQQCVRQNQCQNGYYTQQLPRIQNCVPDTDVCCTYRAPPTQSTSTQKPFVTCGRDSDCVPPRDCRNGEIFAIDYVKKSTSDRCYAPEVCCRMPSTTLTNDGYIFNVPDKKFPIPTNPTVPQRTTQRPYPQPTQGPQPTQPAYQPQPTQPTYRPQPTQPTYRPQPTQPTYRPQPTYRQPTQTSKLPNEYLPPTSTQQTYRPQPQPQTTQQTYRPQPQPQSTQQSYRPQPQPQSTQQTYRPQPQPQTTQQTYRPQPQPQTTRQTYNPQPTQPTYRQPQTTKLSNEYLPPTRPTQPPQRPTPTPYRPTQPPRQPQTTPNNQYLPPDSENEIPSRPKYPSYQPDREPQPSNVKHIRGEDILSPSIANPNFNNNQNQVSPSRHFAKCASALLCTEETYCNSIGVINDTPVILSPMEQAFRVPLTDCIIEATGAGGKCCRDSNYVDPWPVNLAGVCATINKNTKPVGIQDIDANFAQIPWQVMILKESSKTLLCGGAIIGDEFVLTTAACVNGLSVSDAKIKAGEWELGRTEEPLPFQLLGAKSIETHPEYNPSTGANDMAIIRLEKRLEFATHIKPVCISDQDPSPTERCVTTGWGKQALQIHEEGAIMHVTDTRTAARSECGADATSVCATTKFDACQFDAGSALACGTGSSVLLKGIFAGENACGEGQAVRFSKPDVKWINTHFAVKNKPFLLKRF